MSFQRRKFPFHTRCWATAHTFNTMNANKFGKGKGRGQDFIKEAIKDYLIMIDTCALLHTPYQLFFNHAAPHLKQEGKHVILPVSVVHELEKYPNNPRVKDKKEARAKIDSIQRDLQSYRQQGILELYGDPKDSKVADDVFLGVIARLRSRHNLLLITQDKRLGEEVEQLGTSQAVRGIKKVCVCRINNSGYLMHPSAFESPSSCHATKLTASNCGSSTSIPSTLAFTPGRSVRAGKGDLLPVHGKIEEGSTLNAVTHGNTRSVRLGKRLGGGGEGDVYETTDGTLVAKVYKPQCTTSHKRDKLQLMLDHRAACRGVCFPQALLYNNRQEFVGYLMPRARGHELQSLFTKPVMQQSFPNWKKADLVQLCLTIVQKVKCLHRMNLILGDINANNILAVSPKEVYFVDTDSYQVQDYPCPVGKELFTAPEIMGRNYAEFLRTLEHENFALAVLLFMVLMLGKHPYSQQDGGSPADNIRSGMFPYAAGELKGKNAPKGDWVYMWSHLSRSLKDSFYSVFQKGAEHYTPSHRLKDTDWERLLGSYLNGLRNGMLEVDSMSNDLYPTRHKISKDTPMDTCKNCGKRVPEAELRHNLCQNCHAKAYSVTCKRCGNTFTAYPRSDGKKSNWCQDCRHWASGVKMQISCCNCGQSFTITNAEHDYYSNRGLSLPKRCRNCRSGGSNRNSYTSSNNSGNSDDKGLLESIWDAIFG